MPPTPLSAAVCDGRFRFAYDRKSRDALLALTARQPDLRRRLEPSCRAPEYRVAELVAATAARPTCCSTSATCWRSTATATSRPSHGCRVEHPIEPTRHVSPPWNPG